MSERFTPPAETASPARSTCEHCRSENEAGAERCAGCGATMERAQAAAGFDETMPGEAVLGVPAASGVLAETVAAAALVASVEPAASAASATLASGQAVGPYRVLGTLGRGGMGVVYRAVDQRLGRPVALKFLSQELAGEPQARTRFLREARAASALDHLNIATVYDVGEDGGQLYLAIAYYDGETLAARVAARGPLPPEEVTGLLRQIAAGLGAAHAAGIVHRDVKPANIFLTRDGTVKLLDFGLAKLDPVGLPGAGDGAAAGEPLTSRGAVMGTLAYMSPEQLSGGLVDARSDGWSVGVVAYELLTGVLPFQGATAVSLGSRILNEEPPLPSEKLAGIPPHLDQLVMQLLAKRPEERVPSMAALIEALAVGEAEASRAGSARGPVRRARGRSRRWLVLGAGLAALTVAVVVWRWPALPGLGAWRSGTAASMRRSIAVLGFKNLSERSDAAWLSSALGEMLLTELSAGVGLRAIPDEQVAHMKAALRPGEGQGLAADVLQRARAHLGADLVLLGSYLTLGESTAARLRLDVKVQRTSDGETLVSLSESGALEELPALLARVGHRLRAGLGLDALSPEEEEEVRRTRPLKPATARIYAEGLERLRGFDFRAARERFEQAVALEPEHPLLHSALAEACFQLGDEARARAAARHAFETAAQLRSEDRLLIAARYRRINGEPERVVEIYRRLVEDRPDNLEYGLALVQAQGLAGDQPAARATIEALRRLPPPAGEDARLDIAAARLVSGDERQRAQLAGRGAAKARVAGAAVLLAEARVLEGEAQLRLGDAAAAEVAAQEALAASERAKMSWSSPGSAADALLLAGAIAAQRGDVAAEEQVLARRLAGARGASSRPVEPVEPVELDTQLRLAELLAHQGRFPEASEKLAAARVLADERAAGGDTEWVARVWRWQALVEERHGALGPAEAACGEAFARYQALGVRQPPSARPGIAAILARVRYAQGRVGETRQRLEEVREGAEARAPEWLPATLRTLAQVALDAEQAGEAERLARAAEAGAGGASPLVRAEIALTLAEALLAGGREPEARAALARGGELANGSGGYVDERLRVETALARLRARLDPAARAESLRELARLAAEAERLGLVGEGLAARFARDTMDLEDHAAEARSDLVALATRAEELGFGRIASHARDLIEQGDGGEAPVDGTEGKPATVSGE